MPVTADNRVRGVLRPNLVVVFDNEKRFEFRVQCEVPLPDEGQAVKLVRQLRSDDPVQLADAKVTVLKIAQDMKITQTSQRIIEAAFNASIEKTVTTLLMPRRIKLAQRGRR